MRGIKTTFLAILSTVTLAGRLGATDYYISTTGSDGNDCLTAATACATIQHAIDLSASAGDRVLVAAGSYVENLVITKDLTVDGESGTVVDGGGLGTVVALDGATVTLRDLVITNGLATGFDGGGVSATNATLTIANCTLRDNQAPSVGGGLRVWATNTTVSGSTVSGNLAPEGGGIYVTSGDLVLDDATVSGNRADTAGGGITLRTGTLSVRSSTIADNVAGVSGGGISRQGGTLSLRNSILAGNQAGSGPDCAGQVASTGYTLIGDVSGCTVTPEPTDRVGVDPLLAPLADNGGMTPTRALRAGSPAIDAGDPAGCTSGSGSILTRDQRGRLRAVDCGQGPRCDLGAFENEACSVLDVTTPAEVRDLRAVRRGDDVWLSWQPVTSDRDGQPETIDHYRIYRDPARDFVPDSATLGNLAGTAGDSEYFDLGVVTDGASAYYIVSAVDRAGNERRTVASRVTTPPVLSAAATATTIDLDWTDAQPVGEVAGYRVAYGTLPGSYEHAVDVGLVTTWSLTDPIPDLTYDFVVTALDHAGNESDRSNEVAARVVADTVRLPVMDDVHLCYLGRGPCSPLRGQIQKDSGREILVPVTFPEGAWVLAQLVVTIDSHATVVNPGVDCVWPNPTGDIYDRLMTVFLVEDETCLGSGSCWGGQQLELVHAVTPFGTDSRTGPRQWTVDLTPFTPLLSGRKYIGVNITTWDGAGWWADVELYLSERPAEASPKPPASGFQLVYFSGGSAATVPVSVAIPAGSTDVKMRLWVSGHGGADPGGDPRCIGPMDEFCQRDTRLLVDGSPVWTDIPWRTDCSPATDPCPNFNACGWTSCTYDRAGWCPGFLTCHDNEICDQDLDALTWLPPGETHDLQYEIDAAPGSWWSHSLVVYWY